jgi:hypothetical protein
VIVALLLATFVVTGCRNNDPKSVAVPGSPGIGHGIKTKGEPAATWVRRWNTIAITVFGSSSCPPVPTRVQADAHQGLITVTISENYKGPCTADLAPYTSVIELHQEMNARHRTELLIRQAGRSDVRLHL